MSAEVQAEVRDGVRCAVCEARFGQEPDGCYRGIEYVPEQDVMVHRDVDTCKAVEAAGAAGSGPCRRDPDEGWETVDDVEEQYR